MMKITITDLHDDTDDDDLTEEDLSNEVILAFMDKALEIVEETLNDENLIQNNRLERKLTTVKSHIFSAQMFLHDQIAEAHFEEDDFEELAEAFENNLNH